jgi:uncharacterized SAM-binding protein YcdF (DUF218 family)
MIKKIIKFVVAFFLVLLILDAGLIWGVAHQQSKIDHADAIIVLGAAINTPALVNRTMKGLELYEQGKADVMVLSGGKIAEADISEAEFMEKVIKKNSHMPVHYLLEDQSHNTYENINNAKAELGDADSLIVVSDAFHLARAVILAKRAGFKNVYWQAPSSGYYSRSELRYYYLREFVAMVNYWPKFIFG